MVDKIYAVSFANGEQAHVCSNSVSEAMYLAESRFGLKAVDAELVRPRIRPITVFHAKESQ